MSMDLTLKKQIQDSSVNKIGIPVLTQSANQYECGWMEISGQIKFRIKSLNWKGTELITKLIIPERNGKTEIGVKNVIKKTLSIR